MMRFLYLGHRVYVAIGVRLSPCWLDCRYLSSGVNPARLELLNSMLFSLEEFMVYTSF